MPEAAALFVEYPGFGGRAGRPSDQSIMAAATAAYDWLADQSDVHASRIFSIGRSLGGYAKPPTPRWLQESVVTADQVLIEYTFAEDQLIAFVVTPVSSKAVRLDVTESEIRGLVARVRARLEALKRGDLNLAQVEWDLDAASLLYRRLIEPLEDLLSEAAVLLVIPEGILWHVPFDALVVRARRLSLNKMYSSNGTSELDSSSIAFRSPIRHPRRFSIPLSGVAPKHIRRPDRFGGCLRTPASP